MKTLGSVLTHIEESFPEGNRRYEHDYTKCKSYPQVSVAPLEAFRKSLERVVKKAKDDFIDCVYQHTQGDPIHNIVSFVPQTEACYACLSGDHIAFEFDRKEFRATFDQIWLEFLGWMKEQGLLLWMNSYRNDFGVRNFVLLEAFVRKDESLAAERERWSPGWAPERPRFHDLSIDLRPCHMRDRVLFCAAGEFTTCPAIEPTS